jgi:hypothetical protein
MAADDKAGDGVGKPHARRRQQEVAELRDRIVQLEADIVECRAMNERLSNVTDAVAEVLLPDGQRDDARIRTLLARRDLSGSDQ